MYGGMQQSSMSSMLSIGDKVKCTQAGGNLECYVGSFIESKHSNQRRYTVLVWNRTGVAKGELSHVGLNGIQAVTPRVSMKDEDQTAMLADAKSFEMTNPKSAYNATNAALKAAAGGDVDAACSSLTRVILTTACAHIPRRDVFDTHEVDTSLDYGRVPRRGQS